MTANKGFKKLARERARQTGESYTAARYRLLPSTRKELGVTQLQMRGMTDEALGFTFVAVSKVLAKTTRLRDNVTLGDWVDAVVAGLTAKGAQDIGREPVRLGAADAIGSTIGSRAAARCSTPAPIG